MSSTAGAKHLAESEQWMAAQRAPQEPEPEPTAKLYEAAAAHDGQPATEWLKMLYRRYGWLD